MRLISGLILLTLVIFAVSCGSSDGRVANIVVPPTFATVAKNVSLTGGATTADVVLDAGTAKVTIPTGTQIVPTIVGPVIGDNVTVELTDGSGSANAQTPAPAGFDKAGRGLLVVKNNGTIIPVNFTKPLAVELPVAPGVTNGYLYGLYDSTGARILSGTWKAEKNTISIMNGFAKFQLNYSGIYCVVSHQQGGN